MHIYLILQSFYGTCYFASIFSFFLINSLLLSLTLFVDCEFIGINFLRDVPKEAFSLGTLVGKLVFKMTKKIQHYPDNPISHDLLVKESELHNRSHLDSLLSCNTGIIIGGLRLNGALLIFLATEPCLGLA